MKYGLGENLILNTLGLLIVNAIYSRMGTTLESLMLNLI